MGNLISKEVGLTSTSIEKIYAARASAAKKYTGQQPTLAPSLDKTQPHPDDWKHATTKESNANVNSSFADASRSLSERIRQAKAVREISIPISNIPAKALHSTRASRAIDRKVNGAVNSAMEKPKKFRLIAVAKVAGNWMKDRRWEAAAIAVPLFLLGCTPAILSAVGFTASGVAAGSIAAGIQAGIGSVAAGSTFATFTSAAMDGYGVPIVYGSLWVASTAVMGGIAVWKRWRGKGRGGQK